MCQIGAETAVNSFWSRVVGTIPTATENSQKSLARPVVMLVLKSVMTTNVKMTLYGRPTIGHTRRIMQGTWKRKWLFPSLRSGRGSLRRFGTGRWLERSNMINIIRIFGSKPTRWWIATPLVLLYLFFVLCSSIFEKTESLYPKVFGREKYKSENIIDQIPAPTQKFYIYPQNLFKVPWQITDKMLKYKGTLIF